MTPLWRAAVVIVVLWLVPDVPAHAQDEPRAFAGAIVGVSALSADAEAVADPPQAAVSLYAPGNGPALNVFGGWHLSNYVSLQANYVWNRNDLSLVSSRTTATGGAAYEQQRSSQQHAVVADGLVYFRALGSRIRPYLGTGLAVVRFASDERGAVSSGLPVPAPRIRSTRLALRSHVGIDLALSSRIGVRYSFSETIGGNPISPYLDPPGQRALMNFQNLVGLVTRF